MTEAYELLFASVRGFKGHVTRAVKALNKLIDAAHKSPSNQYASDLLDSALNKVKAQGDKLEGALNRILQEACADDQLDSKERDDITKQANTEMEEYNETLIDATNRFLEAVDAINQALLGNNLAQPQVGANQLHATSPSSKQVEALKPDKLTKETTPVEFRIWHDRFVAYYDAANFQNLSIITQHAFVYALLDGYLTQILETKVTARTPVFGDAHSMMSFLREEFDQLFPTFIRRLDFFRYNHAGKQKFSEFLVKLTSLSQMASLQNLDPDQILVFKALSSCNNKDLAEKLLKLEEPNLLDIHKEVRLYEQVQHGLSSMNGQNKTSHVKSGPNYNKKGVNFSTSPKGGGKPQITFDKLKKLCWHCAGDKSKHASKDCPNRDSICSNCNKKGHTAKACLGVDYKPNKGHNKGKNNNKNKSNSTNCSRACSPVQNLLSTGPSRTNTRTVTVNATGTGGVKGDDGNQMT